MEKPSGKIFGWLTRRKHLAMPDPYDLSPKYFSLSRVWEKKKILNVSCNDSKVGRSYLTPNIQMKGREFFGKPGHTKFIFGKLRGYCLDRQYRKGLFSCKDVVSKVKGFKLAFGINIWRDTFYLYLLLYSKENYSFNIIHNLSFPRVHFPFFHTSLFPFSSIFFFLFCTCMFIVYFPRSYLVCFCRLD